MPYKPVFDNLPNTPTFMDVVKVWNKETFGNALFAFPKKGYAPHQQIKDIRKGKEITPLTTVAEIKKEIPKKEKKPPSEKQKQARAKFSEMVKEKKKKTADKEKSVKEAIASIIKEEAVVIPNKEFKKEHEELVEVLKEGTKEEQKKEAKKQEEEAKKQEESESSSDEEEKEITWDYILEKDATKYVDDTSKSQMIKLLEQDYPTLKGENKKKVIKNMNAWRLREIEDKKLAKKAQPLEDKRQKIKEELRGDVTPKKRANLTKQMDEITKKIDAIVEKGSNVVSLINKFG